MRAEFWGLIGLIADVIVDWATWWQNLANRRFRVAIDREVTRDTTPARSDGDQPQG